MGNNIHNAADPGAIKKKEKINKTKRFLEAEEIKSILSTKLGRRFIWRHMSDAGIFTSCFTGNSATFFNEGKRDVGLKILAEVMEYSPDSFVTMMKESKETEEE